MEERHQERLKAEREWFKNYSQEQLNNLAAAAEHQLKKSASEGSTYTSITTNKESAGGDFAEAKKLAADAMAKELRRKGYNVRIEEIHSTYHGGSTLRGYTESPEIQLKLHISADDPSDT